MNAEGEVYWAFFVCVPARELSYGARSLLPSKGGSSWLGLHLNGQHRHAWVKATCSFLNVPSVRRWSTCSCLNVPSVKS